MYPIGGFESKVRTGGAERRARAATDTARALLDAGDVPAAFAQLQWVEAVALQEACRPSVRALTAEVAARRPGLPGITAFARRTAAAPGHVA
jgi:hypothetical protein